MESSRFASAVRLLRKLSETSGLDWDKAGDMSALLDFAAQLDCEHRDYSVVFSPEETHLDYDMYPYQDGGFWPGPGIVVDSHQRVELRPID
jgi:hypothetical protein